MPGVIPKSTKNSTQYISAADISMSNPLNIVYTYYWNLDLITAGSRVGNFLSNYFWKADFTVLGDLSLHQKTEVIYHFWVKLIICLIQ